MTVGDILVDPAQPLDARIRDLHDLREPDCPLTRDEKCNVLKRTIAHTKSVLLLHEVMYALGQIGSIDVVPFLCEILRDATHDVVTRHEAGEALGAIGEAGSGAMEVLKAIYEDTANETLELRETCYLAIRRIEGIANGTVAKDVSATCEFQSVDPSPAHDNESLTNAELKAMLADPKEDMWERYRAMFALRNRKDAVSLAEAMVKDTSSALLRHEIAFVLGQLEDAKSVDGLVEMLKRAGGTEHAMVRHEAAEALGAIATRPCWDAIETYASEASEPDALVRDSCVVAQDMFKYYQTWSMANQKKE
eukprot:PhM_4_TR9045/c0_g1_i1/m.9072/K06072/DOHH; deoxyhypusine monooxygenase